MLQFDFLTGGSHPCWIPVWYIKHSDFVAQANDKTHVNITIITSGIAHKICFAWF